MTITTGNNPAALGAGLAPSASASVGAPNAQPRPMPTPATPSVPAGYLDTMAHGRPGASLAAMPINRRTAHKRGK